MATQNNCAGISSVGCGRLTDDGCSSQDSGVVVAKISFLF